MIPEDVEKRLLGKKRKILARKNKEEGNNFKGLVSTCRLLGPVRIPGQRGVVGSPFPGAPAVPGAYGVLRVSCEEVKFGVDSNTELP
jgi:hypothetical protein